MKRTVRRKQFLHDIFVTACEGGSNYWANIREYHWSIDRKGEEADLDKYYAIFEDVEGDGTKWRVDITVVSRGINKIVNGDHKGLHDSFAGQIMSDNAVNECRIMDAMLADCIVQMGLFGEVVYG